LMRTSWRDPAALDAALERLRAELGADAVVKPVANDEHRPERTGSWTTEEGEEGSRSLASLGTTDAPRSPPRSTVDFPCSSRMLESPEPVEVERTPSGAPAAMWWREGRIAIRRAHGPERLSGDWWKDDFSRDYWRCEAEQDAEFLIYRDLSSVRAASVNENAPDVVSTAGAWYLHGWYD
jgi:protein ImuB